jgi:PAS domain S-box-containing protein
MRRVADNPAMAPGQPDRAAVRILLVDDTPQNLLALEAMLGDLRLDLVRAESGAEALRQVLQDDFAVILLDVLMPGMDGLETAALIRARERSRDTPIIFITAAGRDEDLIARGYALGAVDYIVKPVHPVILRSKVAVFVELFRKTAQVREQAAALARLNAGLEERVRARTAQLQAAQAATERERARLEEIFAQMPAAIAVLDGPDHVVTYVNPAGERIAGLRAAALFGRPVREAFPEVAGQGIFNPLDEAYRSGSPYVGTEVPARYDRNGDGVPEEAYFTVVYHPMRDADGVVTGVLQHAWEVTDQVLARRRADELARQVAAERDRLRQVLDVLPEAVLVTDADGLVLSSNAAATEIMGLDMTDRPLAVADPEALDSYGLRHLDGSPMDVQSLPLRRSLAGAVVHGTQLLVRNADGGRDVPILMNSAPLRDASGTITGVVAVFQDISALKSLERQKDEFLASVSHDLKIPLITIRGMAQVLRHQAVQPEGLDAGRLREGLEAISGTAAQIAALLTELLDLTRLRMERPLDLAVQPADLVALIQRVAVAHQQATERHTIQIHSTLSELTVSCDPTRVERVLSNLLSNAVKYSPEGGEITVALSREDDAAGAWAVLQVHDRGMGIPIEDLPYVFERFYRGRNVGSKQGTGLGLASVRQIVEQHGGGVAATRNPDAGTTVTVRLPVAGPHPAQNASLEQLRDRTGSGKMDIRP